ncbi:MAG TPA: hypothetical protein VI756_26545 [Blastocatellia bacterium]
MEDDDLLAQFEDCTLPSECFHHADHLRVTWLYLTRHSLLEALVKMSEGLKRYARAKDKADRYHETITWSFVFLIRERMERSGNEHTWPRFVASNTDLFDWPNSVLKSYYREETLKSDLARDLFILPDNFSRLPGR